MSIFRLSRSELCSLIADRLAVHEKVAQLRAEFFSLPGQDPFEFTSPAAALSALFWRATEPQRRKLVRALLDLAGRRAELMPLRGLEELLLTIGSIAESDALLPFVRVLGARGDLGDQAFTLYGTAIQVALGFGPVEPAWDAAREIAGFSTFPEKLVYDVFDLGLADPREDWHKWFLRLEPAMLRVTNFSRAPAVARRLATTAQVMARQLSAHRIEAGLMALLGGDVFGLAPAVWRHAQEPRTMLGARLIASHDSPLVVVGRPGEYRLAWRPADPPRPKPPPVREIAPGHPIGSVVPQSLRYEVDADAAIEPCVA